VHVKWNQNIAILSGDAMSIKAYEYLAKCDASVLKPVMEVFNRTALQICEGQQFDMNFETLENVSVADYLNMIELKTSVLIAACLKIGAIIGGASPQDADYLYEFGRNIGLAFQLQDDFLDVYGNAETFGKNIGGDIVANKKTFLLINALELAKNEVLTELNFLLENKTFDPKEKIAAVTRIYNQLGVNDLAQAEIHRFFQLGMEALEKVQVEASRRGELRKFAENLLVRNK